MKKREFVVIDLEEKKKIPLDEKLNKIQDYLINFLIILLYSFGACALLALFVICGIFAVKIIWKMIVVLF